VGTANVVEQSHAEAVIDRATNAIPSRLRLSAVAVVADLPLADGRLEGPERRFLNRLGAEMKLDLDTARGIVGVVVIENRL